MRLICGTEQDLKLYTIDMLPWRDLNFQGRILLVACIINVVVAVYFASIGDSFAVFSIVMAAWCGMFTYHPKYQQQTAKDINEGREK